MKLSVIIPTYNRCALLSRTLPTIFQQTCAPNTYEVIVIVDGSTDGTMEMLRELRPPCRLRVLEQPNRGQAAARNAGLRAAHGDLVLSLDDDLLCESDLISEHIAAHQSGENLLVFGLVDVSPESPPTLATRWTRRLANCYTERLRRDGLSFPVDAVVGPNTSASRTTLVSLGGFDEDQFDYALEDFEFGLRLWHAGVQFRLCQSAVTHQVYVKSNRDLVHGDGTAYGKGEIILYRKHAHLRRYSEFARYSEASFTKTFVKELLLRGPIPFDFLASIPCWLAERLSENKRVEQIGLRLLSARRNFAMLRSAVKEAGGWQSFKRDFGKRVPVLLFHNVGPDRPGTEVSLTISPEKFERQICWLKQHGYIGINSADLLSWFLGEKALPEKPVVLTFDDAYSDMAEHALPILKGYGFSATVFVVTSQIGGTSEWDEKRGVATLRCMNAEQIRHWAAEGFEFGAHTRTHADLRSLQDGDLESEIAGSAEDLSRLLGQRVHSFAYPYGHYSEAAKRHVEKVFDVAITCDKGLNGLSAEPALVRRTMVCPRDWLLDLAFYVNLGFTPLNRLRRLRQRLRLFRRSLCRWRLAEPPLQ